jgi:hypothetical protein
MCGAARTNPLFILPLRVLVRIHQRAGGRLARRLAKIARVRLITPPIELAEFRYIQVWHPRMDSDLAHKWLRRMFAEAGVAD